MTFLIIILVVVDLYHRYYYKLNIKYIRFNHSHVTINCRYYFIVKLKCSILFPNLALPLKTAGAKKKIQSLSHTNVPKIVETLK